jgi:hypothetical protein
MAHGERTYAVSALLNHDDGPSPQDARTVGQNGRQSFEHMGRPGVVEAEDDHTRFPATRERRDLAEVESKVRMTRLSKMAFVNISPFGSRWRSWSRR